MITINNINEVINQIDEKTKSRILKSECFEYCILELSVFNAGSITRATLTNDYCKYSNISDYGNCILPIEEVQERITLPN